ncbi:MAG TPA: glycosyltransferase [Candidatus Binataceae bacterium]|nr:glycosyltransferase [Candidatus Binataceae bacterium]
MRILLVSAAVPYHPCHDGFRLVLGSLIAELSGRHEIHLIAASTGGETDEQLAWSRRYCRSVVTVPQARGFSAKFAALSGSADRTTKVAVAKLMAAVKPDIVHVEGGSLASVLRNAPKSALKVLCIHDCKSLRLREFARHESWIPARMRLRTMEELARWHERHWYRFADSVVVTSNADADALHGSVPADRIAVIPSGIDLMHFAYEPAPEPGRIVLTGNMTWPPNEDAAVYFASVVFPKIQKRAPDASFWIVGASPTERVQRVGKMRGVHVTGTVSDLRPWLRSASVYVSPIRFSGGVKIKLLEAMASGAPIVATAKSICATPLIDGEEAMIADDSDRMAEAIAALLTDPERCRQLTLAARKKAESEYGWPQIAARFERLYSELAAERSDRGGQTLAP